MANEAQYESGPLPPNCELIEVHVAELQQLFNAIDPSPFRDKDLSAKVEAFIMSWAKDATRGVPLALLVHVDQPPGQSDAAVVLREAVRAFFNQRALASRQRLRQLFRVGRTSLLIGGWVAMWQPMEIFLCDWWPIRADGRPRRNVRRLPERKASE